MTTDRRTWPILDRQPARAWLWSIGLGLASATGFAPIGLWPVALLAIGAFTLIVARSDSWKQAAWLGWLFGWSHFTFGNNWIATAFTHQAAMPAVLGWVAVPMLAVYLAVYPALAAMFARAVLRNGPSLAFALIFASAWVVTEWMRGWVFTGYAWNPFAMTLLGPFDRPGLAAIAPWMGTYALSGVAIVIGSGAALLAAERRWRVGVPFVALIVAGMYWPAPDGRDGNIEVTIVQPNLEQARIADARYFEANFSDLARLSPRLDPGDTSPRLVLWPESGMADYLEEGYPQRYYDRTTAGRSPLFARRRLGIVAGEGSVLLTGSVDLEIGMDEAGFERAIGALNSVTAVTGDGEILGSYSKSHLVPYGEYLPMRPLLEPLGLSRLVAGSIDFLPGPGPGTIDLGEQGRAGVQICYEIVFPGEVVDPANRPDYIFNPSNDGWFGRFGPPQHLAQARMRAIEEGLPVLRSTVTGISAVIDARGVVRDYLPSNVAGRIDAVIPDAAPPTLFARFGNGLSLAWAALLLLAGFIAMRRFAR